MSFWSFLAGAAAGAAATYVLLPRTEVRSFQAAPFVPKLELGGGHGIDFRNNVLRELEPDQAPGDVGWYALMYELDFSSKGPHLKEYDGPYLHKESAVRAAQAARAVGWDDPGKAKAVVKHRKKAPW